MRYVLAVLCLALLSGAICGGEYEFKVKVSPVEFKVKQAELPPVKATRVAPTEGRHSTTICEQHGCGCGCLRGGSCVCHPGWEKSAGTWYFYRIRGRETGAFDQSSGTYWRRDQAGKWVEWVDVKDEGFNPSKQQSLAPMILAPVYRANVRRLSSC